MAVVNPPLYLNLDGEYAARHLGYPWRFALSEGVTTTGGLAVSQNGTPNMSVNVAAGKAFVLGDDSDQQPLYLVTNDGTVNLAIAAADTTNPRKDIVIFEVRDSQFSGVNDDSQLRVVTGTPDPSPVEPALPNNAIKLAVVDVEANETQILNADITDTRPFAQPGGELGITGKLPLYGTVANRPPAAAGNESQLYYATDEDRLHVSNGSAWRTVWPTIDVVTSGTRPGSPFDGQVIYETDTDLTRIWSASASAWHQIGKPTVSSTPPASPVDGDEWIMPVGTNQSWKFRYNASGDATYKWEFVGGPPLTAWVPESEGTVSAGYTDLATVGPRVAAPRAGVYNVRFGAHVSSSAQWAFIGIHNGAAIVIDLDVIVSGMGTHWRGVAYESPAAVTVGSAGTFITMKYHTAGGTPSASFKHRWLTIVPIRVS